MLSNVFICTFMFNNILKGTLNIFKIHENIEKYTKIEKSTLKYTKEHVNISMYK